MDLDPPAGLWKGFMTLGVVEVREYLGRGKPVFFVLGFSSFEVCFGASSR